VLEDHRKNHQHEPEYKACPESQCPLRSDMRIRDFVQQAKKDEHARAANAQKQKAAGVLSSTLSAPCLFPKLKPIISRYLREGATEEGVN